MKYPIGIQSFEKLREGGYVYVDKTDLIYSLTHEGCVYFFGTTTSFRKEPSYLYPKELLFGQERTFQGTCH